MKPNQAASHGIVNARGCFRCICFAISDPSPGSKGGHEAVLFVYITRFALASLSVSLVVMTPAPTIKRRRGESEQREGIQTRDSDGKGGNFPAVSYDVSSTVICKCQIKTRARKRWKRSIQSRTKSHGVCVPQFFFKCNSGNAVFCLCCISPPSIQKLNGISYIIRRIWWQCSKNTLPEVIE